MAQSKQHQPSVKYLWKPYPSHFNMTSAVKIAVNILSHISKTFLSVGLECMFLSSVAFKIFVYLFIQ